MASQRPPRADDDRKREDTALAIPLFGAVLLLPPFLNLFATRTLLFGVPMEVLYLFLVWILLIVGAVMTSRLLPARTGKTHPGDAGDEIRPAMPPEDE
ncbi:hypothetical protein [Mesorhizobium sp. KR2-14]|uniref:hypothetical protein n=1 Tax=Mesorhizobium sp. KR2-14 TaxID=3156610 RepID=UPI0032B3A503